MMQKPPSRRPKYLQLFLYFFFSFLSTLLYGQVAIDGQLSGKGEALPYANVYVKGSTNGTTTNAEGEFQLSCPENATIVFQYIGFQKKEIKLIEHRDKLHHLEVELEPESYNIEEIVVLSDKEDPAMEMMRQVIAKRKFYLEQIKSFSCQVYIKGIQRIQEAPESFLGFDINIDGLDSNRTGIFYLSESESEYHYERPNNYKETVVSSKVSGEDQGISWNRASDLNLNFYEKNIDLGPISPREFVSPLSPNAFLYYDFSLVGSIEEDGNLIHKIELLPKRNHDPVFNGFLYIQEGAWRIHSLSLNIKKNPAVDIIESLQVNQQYADVNTQEDVWVLISQRFDFLGGIMAFKVNGTFLGVYRAYQVNREFPKNFFGNEVVSIKESALATNEEHWEENRPLALTEEEDQDYLFKDSLKVIRDSDTYKDSLDRISNKFNLVSSLIAGHTIRNTKKQCYLNFGSLLTAINFNTVEGTILQFRPTFSKEWKDKRRLIFGAKIRYGFSNKKFLPSFFTRYKLDNKKSRWLQFSVGSDILQIDPTEAQKDITNTLYTLLGRRNYHKLYRKTEARLSYRSEIVNGIKGRFSLSWQDREELENTTNFSWTGDKEIPYSSNILGGSGKAFVLSAGFTFKFRQKYESLPNEKWEYPNPYPAIRISWSAALPINDNYLDFQKIEMSIEDEFNLKRLGRSSFRINGGLFLSKNRTHVYDNKIFTGNQTVLAGKQLHTFQSLPFYSNFTDKAYTEVFYQHNFGGFILNKIPALRKLRLRTVVGINGLYVDENQNYTEYFIGIENIFQILRIDFARGITDPSNWGIRVHVPLGL